MKLPWWIVVEAVALVIVALVAIWVGFIALSEFLALQHTEEMKFRAWHILSLAGSSFSLLFATSAYAALLVSRRAKSSSLAMFLITTPLLATWTSAMGTSYGKITDAVDVRSFVVLGIPSILVVLSIFIGGLLVSFKWNR